MVQENYQEEQACDKSSSSNNNNNNIKIGSRELPGRTGMWEET